MNKLIWGIGINDSKYPSRKDGRQLREYSLWVSMLYRCTNKFCTKHPTYTNTGCSDNFKNYSFFYEWCQNQVGFRNKGENGRSWQLDKDLLVKGNKLYSEDTCVFVPAHINSLLIKRDASRGDWPIGFHWNKAKSKFHVQCNDREGKLKHLGLFTTPQEAFLAYKPFKEALIKEVANEYKNVLDNRVYQALMQYEVEITD